MDVSTPEWSTSPPEGRSAKEEAGAVELNGGDPMAMSNQDWTSGDSTMPSYERTFGHRVYRFFKVVTVTTALLLLIAQVVSVVMLPFDGIELVLKIFLCTFAVIIMLNEMEWWGMLRESPMLWNWIPRGFFYAFIGLVSLEENNVKPTTSLSNLPVDFTSAVFIETSSWMMFGIGAVYLVMGLFCGQRYITNVRDDYSKRLADRKKIFDEGLQSDAALSRQMIT